jgi:hypothetical protein
MVGFTAKCDPRRFCDSAVFVIERVSTFDFSYK